MPAEPTVLTGLRRDLTQELFEELGKSESAVELYWRDGEHASPYGDYLTAACLAALLCNPADLSALKDEGFDFGVIFEGENGIPVTADREGEARSALDPAKTAVIRSAIENKLLKA